MMWFKKQLPSQPKTLNECIDLTLVDPRAIKKDAQTLVNLAVKNNYRAVVVSPSLVSFVKEYMEKKLQIILPVVATIAFPLGNTTLNAKVAEVKQAIADGADELDVAINIGMVKEGDYHAVKAELQRIVRLARGRVVKAIIETCYLSREEMKNLCKVCVKAKVDYVMTSTGYGTGGATVDDVKFLAETLANKCQVKASGAIRTKAMAEELLKAGASLIGTSKIL